MFTLTKLKDRIWIPDSGGDSFLLNGVMVTQGTTHMVEFPAVLSRPCPRESDPSRGADANHVGFRRA
jgi:hypothetical protein